MLINVNKVVEFCIQNQLALEIETKENITTSHTLVEEIDKQTDTLEYLIDVGYGIIVLGGYFPEN